MSNAQKNNDMTNKVIAKLVKWGWNEENATTAVNEHFEYASTYYSGVSKIADVIASL